MEIYIYLGVLVSAASTSPFLLQRAIRLRGFEPVNVVPYSILNHSDSPGSLAAVGTEEEPDPQKLHHPGIRPGFPRIRSEPATDIKIAKKAKELLLRQRALLPQGFFLPVTAKGSRARFMHFMHYADLRYNCSKEPSADSG